MNHKRSLGEVLDNLNGAVRCVNVGSPITPRYVTLYDHEEVEELIRWAKWARNQLVEARRVMVVNGLAKYDEHGEFQMVEPDDQ
jgi:hypothetical protein